MNIINLIGHLGFLIKVGHDVESIVQNLVQHKEKFPSSDEFKLLVDDAISFVQSGILSLPDEDKKVILDVLVSLKSQLWPVPAA